MSEFRLFNETETRAISEAIRDAEQNTYGEIVPVVAESSGRYDRAEDLCGVVTAALLITVGWFIAGASTSSASEWSSSAGPSLILTLILLGVGFSAGVVIATRFHSVRQLFLSRREMQEEVERRARECFQLYGIGKTRGSTGVLIYVSLKERMVRIQGDSVVAQELDDSNWQSICNTIVSGLAEDTPKEALIRGIEQTGELLSRQFPASGDTALKNELDNSVHQIAAA